MEFLFIYLFIVMTSPLLCYHLKYFSIKGPKECTLN